jgi:hypothetical protein
MSTVGNFNPFSNFNWGLTSPPPPPTSPPSGPPPPPTPAPEAPVDSVIITGQRPPITIGGGYFPFFGGAPVNPPPPPPAGPPPEGVEVVEITAKRQGKYPSKEEAIRAGIAAFQASPYRANRELGFFILKVGDGFDLSELIVGPNDSSLGSFSRDGSNGTRPIPENAIGLLHSHPPSTDTNRNLWPSANDMVAWDLFERATGASDFIMWVVGPDGKTREFAQESDVPNLETPRIQRDPDAAPTPPAATVPIVPVPNPYVRPRRTPEP